MTNYSTKKNKSAVNQPLNNYYLKEAIRFMHKGVSSDRGRYALLLLPYFDNNPRKLASAMKVSHQTIYDWINEYQSMPKGGDNK